MRTTNFFTVIALAAAVLFSACNKDEPQNTGNDDNTDPNQTEEFESTAIVFTATVDGGWEGVSSVAVMIDGTVKEYSVSVSDSDNTSATLNSDDPHYWTSSKDISVTAWWPYTAGETTPPDVVVQADQSTSDDFVGSYFISAEDQTVSYSNPTLTFTSRTARVIVELTDYTEGLQSVKLTNLSTDNSNPAEIIPYEYDKGNFIYTALVAPQTVAQGTAFITCEFNNGGIFFYEMPDDAEWNAGEEYTYNFFAAPDYIYNESTNTYTVYKAGGLLAWNEAVQNNLSLNCTLAFDVDLTGIDYEWLQVGNSSSNSYTGTFEGGGYTITGLTVNQSGNYAGLIGILGSGGKVQNLTLKNVDITGSYWYIGGVVGRNYGTVTNCNVSGNVNGNSYVGGVVGNNTSTVIACYSTGNVTGTYEVGGVVGGNEYASIVACYYTTGSVSGSSGVGGVMGWNGGTVTACYSTGNVSGTGSYVGSVVGNNTSGTVTTCYWSGYDGDGIGYDYNNSGDATKVDGSDVTWADAVEGMNSALQSRSSDWRYELIGDLPTLKKNE